MTLFYDTNALLELQEDAFKKPFFISSETLYELENIKTSRSKDDTTKYKARKVTHLLNDFEDRYTVIFHEVGDNCSPDEKICYCANDLNRHLNDGTVVPTNTPGLDGPVLFITDDVSCRNLARSIYGLDVKGCGNGAETIYKGYQVLEGTTDEINQWFETPKTFYENEYLVIKNTETGKESEMRFTKGSFVPLKLPSTHVIKGKNALQRCALDALNNDNIPIVCLLGTYGSGKTYLAMKMALHAVKDTGKQSKILGVRVPRGEGDSVGFLPGELSDKIDGFFDPLVQSLDGKQYEMEALKQQGCLEVNVPYYMKGCTYTYTNIICDEAEDFTRKQLKLIGTRLGEGSRIFFSGDYKQSLVERDRNNPLVNMCNELKGNELFACVCLDTDVRSETSKLFAGLFSDD